MLINFDHLKTFSKALNIKMKGFRGNWNQNDPTADDYIKNRPFYSEGLKETIIIDEVVNFNAGINEAAGPMVYNGFIENSSIKPFTPNQKYTVIWNGKTYDCKATNLDGMGVIGNAYLLGFMGSAAEFEDTGEPFFIGIETGFGVFLLSTQAGNVSVVVKSVEEKIHKLDKKFIDMPDGIVTEDALADVAFTGNYYDLWNIPNVYTQDEVYANYMKFNTVKCIMPSYTSWQSVTYGNGKFVAVSNSNIAAYSEDGITWIQTTLPSSIHWQSVAHGNGKFVAVANSNTAAYSEDGVTWIQTTMPVSASWGSVTYGNDKFVSVSNNTYTATAAYSEDGITWIKITMPFSASWKSVTYGNNKFVAVSNTNRTAYSEDGINWTQTTLPSSVMSLQSVTYGNGKFVSVRYYSNIAAYSEDGITWTQTTLPSSLCWYSVAYGNGKFVAVASDTSIAAYSEDGVTWIQTTMPSSVYWNSVTYGNDKFVASVGNYSNISVYSKDGIIWTDVYTYPSQNGVKITLEQLGIVDSNVPQPDWNQIDDTQKDYIKNKPNEDDALELISEMGLVEPVLSEDGFVFVDETGAIYSIL